MSFSRPATVLLLAVSLLPIALGVWLMKAHLRVRHRSPFGVFRGGLWILLGVGMILAVAGAAPAAGIVVATAGLGLGFSNYAKALWVRHQRRAAAGAVAD